MVFLAAEAEVRYKEHSTAEEYASVQELEMQDWPAQEMLEIRLEVSPETVQMLGLVE
jgi:hypothetical protein